MCARSSPCLQFVEPWFSLLFFVSFPRDFAIYWMTVNLEVLFLYAFLSIISCLCLWQNIFGNKLKGASFFARNYVRSNFSFVSGRSFLFVSASSWIVLCWPACSYKYCSFSLWSLGFKSWLPKSLSNAAFWATPLAWSLAELCWSLTHLSEVHQTSW